jgi:site-specific recombinase XerD
VPASRRFLVPEQHPATWSPEQALTALDDALTPDEARYVDASRAPNTRRGYAADWRDFAGWCADHRRTPMPATPVTISLYLTALAGHGAKVGTIARRLSTLRLLHRLGGHGDPTADSRVTTVWDGIRRVHGAPPVQSAPLMPPDLWDVLAACPTVKEWAPSAKRAPQVALAGARDRALLLVGFVGALRRSELAALTVDDLEPHPSGLTLVLPRSKTNQDGAEPELVILPRAPRPERCPVTALQAWLDLAGIVEGPIFRGVTKANRPAQNALHGESINELVQAAVARAGIDPTAFSAHSLRAGFVTYAHLQGASMAAIARQTRHSSMRVLASYVRVQEAWTDNAATRVLQ